MLERPETAVDLLIYGGTFDPPHAGHYESVAAARAQMPKAKILVLPAPAPAGADGAHKSPVVGFKERLALSKLAFAPLGPNVEVSAFEADLPEPNFTVTTLRALAKAHPGKKLGLLIGADQWQAFGRWKEPAEIARLAQLVVVQRPGMRPPDAESKAWPALVLEARVSDAASSLIRKYLAEGKSVPVGWLQTAVNLYIREHHLYATRG